MPPFSVRPAGRKKQPLPYRRGWLKPARRPAPPAERTRGPGRKETPGNRRKRPSQRGRGLPTASRPPAAVPAESGQTGIPGVPARPASRRREAAGRAAAPPPPAAQQVPKPGKPEDHAVKHTRVQDGYQRHDPKGRRAGAAAGGPVSLWGGHRRVEERPHPLRLGGNGKRRGRTKAPPTILHHRPRYTPKLQGEKGAVFATPRITSSFITQ